jgi:hypothetical protein
MALVAFEDPVNVCHNTEHYKLNYNAQQSIFTITDYSILVVVILSVVMLSYSESIVFTGLLFVDDCICLSCGLPAI